MRWLIFGGKGWIGQQLCDILESQDETIIYASSRADNEIDVKEELSDIKPDRVISALGRAHGPGVNSSNYLQSNDKLLDNVRDNLYAPLALSILCDKFNIHLTYIGTSALFSDDQLHNEEDIPNFYDSNYSLIKGFTDRLMHFFESSTLNCRIGPCVCTDKSPYNILNKLLSYRQIHSVPTSISVLPIILPLIIDMAKNRHTGTFNMVNPGLISNNEILQMIKDIGEPTLTWENFTLETPQPANLLNNNKLLQLYPNIPSVDEAIKDVITKIYEK